MSSFISDEVASVLQQSLADYERLEQEEAALIQRAMEDSLRDCTTVSDRRETTDEIRTLEAVLAASVSEQRDRLEQILRDELLLSQRGPIKVENLHYPPHKDFFLRKARYFLQRKLGVGLRLLPGNLLAISYRDDSVLDIAKIELHELFTRDGDGSAHSADDPAAHIDVVGHHWVDELMELRKEVIHIFVDNSNIYHSARYLRNAEGKNTTDFTVRLKAAALAGLVTNHRVCNQRVVFGSDQRVAVGSNPPSSAGIWAKWAEAGFEVHCQDRAPGQGEQMVDDAIIAMMNAAISRFAHLQHQGKPPHTLVLLTGDGNLNHGRANFIESVDLALRLGWKVELWTWRASVHHNYLRMLDFYADSGLFTINFLDEYRDFITFSANTAPAPTATATATATAHPAPPPHEVIRKAPMKPSFAEDRGGGRGGRGGRGRGGRGRGGRDFAGHRYGRGRGRGFQPVKFHPHPSPNPDRERHRKAADTSSDTAAPAIYASSPIAEVSAPPPVAEDHEEDDFEIIEADGIAGVLTIDEEDDGSEDDEEDYDYMTCPISLNIFENPVRSPYGHYFERAEIEAWIEKEGACPLTRLPLSIADLIVPDESFMSELYQYKAAIVK